jgi:hypothetical protein
MAYKGGNLQLGAVKNVTTLVTSVGAALPTGDGTYLISCNQDTFVEWGVGAQTATAVTGYKVYMPAGFAMIVDMQDATHFATIWGTETGIFSITAVEGV